MTPDAVRDGSAARRHRWLRIVFNRAGVVLASSAALAGVLSATGAASAQTVAPVAAHPATAKAVSVHGYKRACTNTTTRGQEFCMALVNTGVAHRSQLSLGPDAAPAGAGYGPASLQSAYSLPSSTAGSGETVAVVDAYDDPNAQADLNTYRSDWGLPACGSGCFQKVNQNGQASPLPSAAGNTGWDVEESLDIEMVSAICPNCHILLVEANSPSTASLGTGVNSAVSLGAMAVSNSYGGSESASDSAYDTEYYNHPGVAITASAGDAGYGASYPSASQYVTSVGGTSLTQSSNSRGWTESVWSTSRTEGTGAGCSADDPKPTWQTDTGCARRTVNDVAAVADPNTGVAVYDSYSQGGWVEVGGTSASSPLIASVFALAGKPAAGTYPSSYIYQHTTSLYDVTTGSVSSCSPAYLCTAEAGYDGPTGWGTPDGTAAFTGGTTTTSNTVTVTNPGNQTSAVGAAVSLQVQASDSASGQALTYSATGLPAGLSISSSTGLISGTPSAAGSATVTVTVADGTGAKGSATFTWTVNPATTTSNTVTVTNPGNQTSAVGTAVSLQVQASDSASGQALTYSATGLPAGLSISSSTGLISGTPSTAGSATVTVTVADGTGATGSATFTWTVNATGTGCTAQQLLGNPGFETGNIAPWTSSPGVLSAASGVSAHSGSYLAWLNGYIDPHTDYLAQTVTIPANCASAAFSFWLDVSTDDPAGAAYDTLQVQVLNSSGTVLSTLGTFSNQTTTNGYKQYSFSVAPYIGQTITLKFTGTETLYGYFTTFLIDDNALNVS